MIDNSIPNNAHKRCLICGNENPWSLGLQFKVENDGWVSSEFQANEKLQGYDDILHGGVISALLDAAMTHCIFHHGIQALTGELLVRFLHPVPFDSKLDLRACLLHDKSPLYIVKSELICKDKIMAHAKAKFIRR